VEHVATPYLKEVLTAEGAIPRPVFLNRRTAARYRPLASIIPGRKRFSWNLSF